MIDPNDLENGCEICDKPKPGQLIEVNKDGRCCICNKKLFGANLLYDDSIYNDIKSSENASIIFALIMAIVLVFSVVGCNTYQSMRLVDRMEKLEKKHELFMQGKR